MKNGISIKRKTISDLEKIIDYYENKNIIGMISYSIKELIENYFPSFKH